jgi:hypothetical protein
MARLPDHSTLGLSLRRARRMRGLEMQRKRSSILKDQ